MSEKEPTAEIKRMPNDLPLFSTDELVIFPGVVTPLVVKEEDQIKMVTEVLAGDVRMLAVVLKKSQNGKDNGKARPSEIYDVGCAANIVKMIRIPDGSMRLLVQGTSRIKLTRVFKMDDGILAVRVQALEPDEVKGIRLEALTRSLRDDFAEVIDAAPYLPYEMKVALININDPGSMADFIGANLNIKPEDRQKVLATVDVEARLKLASKYVKKELELLKLGSKLQNEVTERIEKGQREYFLREQLKAIRRELGEDEESSEVKELKAKLEKFDAPDHAKEAVNEEIERLGRINPSSAEYTVSRSYIDWLFDLPWRVSTEDQIDIDQAQKILNRDHYGLEDVKDRILEFLAVRKLKAEGKGSILCFVGPPGVGKTSIGKSIAEAMERKFVRMSLGGLRDEAEIRGHRRTYIGALPGRIIQNIKRAGTNNPVFMLDEIDKLGSDFRGDPSSAMLEVLDQEQNLAFQDNYIEVDFDLSKVMFITTANYLETIPPPLRDRMELIKLSGYVTPEKVQIAKRYLAPRQIEANGLTGKMISFTDTALERIAVHYTREAGVRTLERTIGRVCRKVAVNVAAGKKTKVRVNNRNYTDFLGSPRVMPLLHTRKPEIGIANGLAWTAVGGVMLLIEAISMPGEGKIRITGQLGDVMKESAEIAMSFLRKRAEKLRIPEDYFKKNDFHLHIPEGATPKDGPSAGITITSALASLFTNRPVRHDVVMTGEITLQGHVLPIGGLREKAVAAARGHMATILCPAENRADLEDIPDIVKSKLEFKFVESLDEVLRHSLLPKFREKQRRSAA